MKSLNFKRAPVDSEFWKDRHSYLNGMSNEPLSLRVTSRLPQFHCSSSDEIPENNEEHSFLNNLHTASCNTRESLERRRLELDVETKIAELDLFYNNGELTYQERCMSHNADVNRIVQSLDLRLETMESGFIQWKKGIEEEKKFLKKMLMDSTYSREEIIAHLQRQQTPFNPRVIDPDKDEEKEDTKKVSQFTQRSLECDIDQIMYENTLLVQQNRDKDAEIALLRGENRKLTFAINDTKYSLESVRQELQNTELLLKTQEERCLDLKKESSADKHGKQRIQLQLENLQEEHSNLVEKNSMMKKNYDNRMEKLVVEHNMKMEGLQSQVDTHSFLVQKELEDRIILLNNTISKLTAEITTMKMSDSLLQEITDIDESQRFFENSFAKELRLQHDKEIVRISDGYKTKILDLEEEMTVLKDQLKTDGIDVVIDHEVEMATNELKQQCKRLRDELFDTNLQNNVLKQRVEELLLEMEDMVIKPVNMVIGTQKGQIFASDSTQTHQIQLTTRAVSVHPRVNDIETQYVNEDTLEYSTKSTQIVTNVVPASIDQRRCIRCGKNDSVSQICSFHPGVLSSRDPLSRTTSARRCRRECMPDAEPCMTAHKHEYDDIMP
ncbi:hypothetical protein PCE1_002124 [Barthelona sp. PCE]